MPYTLGELAARIGATVQGDATVTISGAAPLGTAGPGDITLVDAPERLKRLTGHPAAAVLLPPGITTDKPAIVAADVHAAFAEIVKTFRPPRVAARGGISPRAFVSPSARLGPNVEVQAGATIGDDVEIGAGSTIHSGVQIMAGCKLGEHVTLFPNVVLYENTIVGARVIIHACAVLGAYGFGYRTAAGRHELTAQLGYVEVGDDVEIGAGSTIDRGTYGPTRIGTGTKIDDQVMIGHNCIIGRHNLICSQVGIAGSSSTGDYVVLAGQAGLRDHIHIGNQAIVMAAAGVMNDIPDGEAWFGSPATPRRDQMLQVVNMRRLPEMRKQLNTLEAEVAALRKMLDAKSPTLDRQAA